MPGPFSSSSIIASSINLFFCASVNGDPDDFGVGLVDVLEGDEGGLGPPVLGARDRVEVLVPGRVPGRERDIFFLGNDDFFKFVKFF